MDDDDDDDDDVDDDDEQGPFSKVMILYRLLLVMYTHVPNESS